MVYILASVYSETFADVRGTWFLSLLYRWAEIQWPVRWLGSFQSAMHMCNEKNKSVPNDKKFAWWNVCIVIISLLLHYQSYILNVATRNPKIVYKSVKKVDSKKHQDTL